MILGIMLARGGSKGVPRKNVRLLGGKPLIAWTVETAHRADLDAFYVSTDDAEISEVVAQLGAPVIDRPAALAQDDTPTLPALQHAVLEAEEREQRRAEYVIELRATGPFKTAADVNQVIAWLSASGAESVIGVTPAEHPARIKYLNAEGYLRSFLPEPESGRRQDLQPQAYVRNGTIYGFRRDALFGVHARVFGHEKSLGFVMPAERSVNIDTESDFEYAEYLIRRRAGEFAQGQHGAGLRNGTAVRARRREHREGAIGLAGRR